MEARQTKKKDVWIMEKHEEKREDSDRETVREADNQKRIQRRECIQKKGIKERDITKGVQRTERDQKIIEQKRKKKK